MFQAGSTHWGYSSEQDSWGPSPYGAHSLMAWVMSRWDLWESGVRFFFFFQLWVSYSSELSTLAAMLDHPEVKGTSNARVPLQTEWTHTSGAGRGCWTSLYFSGSPGDGSWLQTEDHCPAAAMIALWTKQAQNMCLKLKSLGSVVIIQTTHLEVVVYLRRHEWKKKGLLGRPQTHALKAAPDDRIVW